MAGAALGAIGTIGATTVETAGETASVVGSAVAAGSAAAGVTEGSAAISTEAVGADEAGIMKGVESVTVPEASLVEGFLAPESTGVQAAEFLKDEALQGPHQAMEKLAEGKIARVLRQSEEWRNLPPELREKLERKEEFREIMERFDMMFAANELVEKKRQEEQKALQKQIKRLQNDIRRQSKLLARLQRP